MSGSFLFEMTQFSVCSNPTPHTILGTCGLLLGDFFSYLGCEGLVLGGMREDWGISPLVVGSEPDS